MYFGALGIDSVKINGELNVWTTNQTGKINWFNWQAILLVAGIICIGVLPFLGKEKKSDDEKLKPLLEKIQKRDSLLIKSMQLLIEQQKISIEQQRKANDKPSTANTPKSKRNN